MAEYESGSGEKKQYEDKLSVMHYNQQTNAYKVFSANPSVGRDGKKDTVFISIREGVKGQPANKLVLACSKSEIAYIIMELTKIFNKDLE